MRFLQGDLQASGVSGELELENLDGAISISTVSGEVDASNLLGNLHLSTVSGDVTLEHSDLQSLKLSTISARVEIETAIHPDGVYRLSTISGDIDWLMPEDPACRVKSSAISGRVVVASPGTRTHHTSGKRHSLILGEGGPDVILSSISGDLKIHTSIATPATI
jgi:DUF4097 and DUF4098 domain-containing protein YvlB